MGGASEVDRDREGSAHDGGKEGGGRYDVREGKVVTSVGGEGW